MKEEISSSVFRKHLLDRRNIMVLVGFIGGLVIGIILGALCLGLMVASDRRD